MEMRSYFFVLLMRGPTWSPAETPEVKNLQEAHLAHIESMRTSGKLVLAGPFIDNKNLRGILILDVETLEEARALCSTDPMVRIGHLRYEIHPWMTGANTFQ